MYIQSMIVTTQLDIFILAGLVIILLVWVIFLHFKVRGLLKGGNGTSLEDAIMHTQAETESLRNFEKECLTYFSDVEKRLSRSIQAVETVRFNPFKGTGDGGNQSFATILTTERGNGVIISSLSTRDHVSVFSKPLLKFQSTFDLTDEENSIIEEAKASLKQQKA